MGSFSVQEDSPFGTTLNLESSLYCQRFAEGDAAVLEQKMARDCIKHYAANPLAIVTDFFSSPLRAFRSAAPPGLVLRLALAKARLAVHMLVFGRDKKKAVSVWLEAHELVTSVAVLQCRTTIATMIGDKK